MANGFFLGGVADGMTEAEKQRLERETLATNKSLKERELSQGDQKIGLEGQRVGIADRAQKLAENNAVRAANQERLQRLDKQVSDTMAVVSETVKQGLAAGRDMATIQKAVTPLIDSVRPLYAKTGRDPSLLDAQVGALISGPTQGEAVAATAATKAAEKRGETLGAVQGQIEGQKLMTEEGIAISPFKNPKDKVEVENSLRDDFLKQAQPFIQVRDAKNRFDQIETTGAGDIGLVFQFMKILDPGSTVREGEFATASNAAGVPAQVIAQYNKALGGGILSPKARTEIKSQADKFYQAASKQHDRLQASFASIAKRSQVDPSNVVIDLSPNSDSKAGKGPPAPPPGFNLVK